MFKEKSWSVPSDPNAALVAATAAAIAAGVNAAVLPSGANLFVCTTPTTVNTSTAETTLLGAGVGSLTIPLALLSVVGATYTLDVEGVIGTHSTAGVPTFRLKIGSKTLASPAPVLAISLSARPFSLRATIVVTTAGAAGVVQVGGTLEVWETAAAAVVTKLTGAVSSTDLSADSAIGLTIQWSASNAANTATLQTAVLTRVR